MRLSLLLALTLSAQVSLGAQQDSLVTERGDSVSIRLVDVDLRAAVQALSRYMDRPVVFSGAPGARVTLETPHAVARADVPRLLRGMLDSQGMELVDDTSSGIYRLRTRETAPAAPTVPAGAPGAQGVELFVIHLRHAKAAEVAATVNALYGRASALGELGQRTEPTLSNGLAQNQVPPAGAPPIPQAVAGVAGQSATLSGETTIVPDARANSLLIRATRSDFSLIQAAVNELDVRVSDSFDRAYRTDSLSRLVERANGSGAKFQTFDYINDRLTYWTKWAQSGTPTCRNLDGWGYDCTGSSPSSQGTVSSFYDLVGNPNDASVTLDPGNRLRTYNNVTMLYDADGNMVRRAGTTTDSLIWDDFGQLKAVRQGSTTIASFAYDGFGRRIRKIAGTTTVHYIWDGDQITAEADGSGAITQTYTYYPGIDQLHSVTSGGQTYYASIEPATGDVNGLVNGSTNAVVATYAYTPWGEIESSTQQVAGVNSLRWKGLIWDPETKLYYMRARYYDPKVRRFLSEDPARLEGGINMYAFSDGDPVNRNDPAGLDAQAGQCEELYRISGEYDSWEFYEWRPTRCSSPGSTPPDFGLPEWPEPAAPLPRNPGDRGRGRGPEQQPNTSNFGQCFRNNHFATLFYGAGEFAETAASWFEVGSELSLGSDFIAFSKKLSGMGFGGRGVPYASGINRGLRYIVKDVLKKPKAQPRVLSYGNRATPVLAIIGAFSLGYNVSIAVQCKLGVLR